MSIAVSMKYGTAFTRDITKAYIQSETVLEREVYITARKELEFEDDVVLRVMKPLNSIPGSGLYWYLTYLGHHLDRLGTHLTRVDPCVL